MAMAGPQDGERSALIAKPRSAASVILVVALGALGASVVFAAHSHTAQPQLRTSADGSMRQSSRSTVELFEQGSGSLSLNVEFALCDTGFCTKNGDGLTASCGCLSMRPSENSETRGSLAMGWPAAVLAGSAVYLAALASTDGDDAVASMLETAINDRTLYDGYYDEGPTRVSMWASSNEYFSNPSSSSKCANVSAAQCMGAPCFDRVYDGVWNVTCICPYATSGASNTPRTHEGICEDASGTECAIVGTSYAISSTSNETDSYTEQALESMITAVKEAQVTIRRDECPAYITTDDEEGTHASPA